MRATLSIVPFLAGMLVLIPDPAAASGEFNPAAREHVRIVDGVAWRHTTRLKSVVELNFTFGFHHIDGKAAISKALARISERYGAGGKPAFRILKIETANGGGLIIPPVFTIADLLQGEVMVANNIGNMGGENGMDSQGQQALKAAIDSAGRGYLSIHGSAETSGSLHGNWVNDTLEPRNFQGHSHTLKVPVYIHPAESKHLVLQGVFMSNTALEDVQDESGFNGMVVSDRALPVRMAMYETYLFERDITRDSSYKDKVTLLLKHDDRVPLAVLGPAYTRYLRRGGGVHSYLYRIGEGMTAYVPDGHDRSFMDPKTGFDGGVGDFDRYLAQLLFFLAGYDRNPCDTACLSLPLVDDRDHIVPSATRVRLPGPDANAMKSGAFLEADALGRIKAPRSPAPERNPAKWGSKARFIFAQ